MLPSMFDRNTSGSKFSTHHLLVQLAVLILVKLIVLMVIWYVLIRGHKVQGDAPATAEYFLTTSPPKLQTIPQSSWK